MDLLAYGSALWIGILTSLSPCPLATNIVAISYIGRRMDRPRLVMATGALYTLGRTLAYTALAALIVSSLLSMVEVSNFLQRHINRILGPLLVLTGMVLLELIPLTFSGIGLGDSLQKRVEAMGLGGAVLLGILFALAFCPVSAALYFGSLIPLSLHHESRFLLPGLYGVGTAMPVIAVAVPLSFSARSIGKIYNRLTSLEYWGRMVTGIIFILVGIYLTSIYVFRVL